MRIAVVGIGLMGAPVAHRLAEAGHQVVVHSRRKESARSVLAAGAVWAACAAGVSPGVSSAVSEEVG